MVKFFENKLDQVVKPLETSRIRFIDILISGSKEI